MAASAAKASTALPPSSSATLLSRLSIAACVNAVTSTRWTAPGTSSARTSSRQIRAAEKYVLPLPGGPLTHCTAFCRERQKSSSWLGVSGKRLRSCSSSAADAASGGAGAVTRKVAGCSRIRRTESGRVAGASPRVVARASCWSRSASVREFGSMKRGESTYSWPRPNGSEWSCGSSEKRRRTRPCSPCIGCTWTTEANSTEPACAGKPSDRGQYCSCSRACLPWMRPRCRSWKRSSSCKPSGEHGASSHSLHLLSASSSTCALTTSNAFFSVRLAPADTSSSSPSARRRSRVRARRAPSRAASGAARMCTVSESAA
mmetsp:Transcript_1315/g.4185  ORF Transcript_1315/g.4185 Transcript_1315/m.4185 type:complete len:317 (-) Transcript_1315:1272-2222(-)